MIPGEKNYEEVLRTLLGIITVKAFYRLKAVSFGFADDILNQWKLLTHKT